MDDLRGSIPLLYHVSEEPGIRRFEPRPAESGDSLVWAVDAERLRNYLVPRDCPRVTFYAGQNTAIDDVTRFLGSSPAVIAVESGWAERIRQCRLHIYHLPPETFECVDECAGYYISRAPVTPNHTATIEDVIAEILTRGIELRFMPDLWKLRDSVVNSTLQFSIIRMKNAFPRVTPAFEKLYTLPAV